MSSVPPPEGENEAVANEAVASEYVAFLEVLASRWSSAAASGLINERLLEYLQPRFHRCSTPIKVRIILSFLYVKESVRIENRAALLRILAEAEVDRDEWVKKLSRLLSSFVVVGSIDVRETDSETAFHLVKFLHAQREKHNLNYLNKPPLEAPHLANVLSEKMMKLEPMKSPPQDRRGCIFQGDFLADAKVVADRSNFTPKIDFLAFNADLMRPGEVAMKRAWRKHSEGESGGCG